MTVYEEKKNIVDGVESPYHSHEQNRAGMGIMAEAHYHDYIEILYGLWGVAQIILDGQSYQLSKGDMVLINSRQVHSVTAISPGTNRYLVVKFEPEVLYTTSQTIFEAKYLIPFTGGNSLGQKLFLRSELEGTCVSKALRRIQREYNRKEYGYELAIRTSIFEIFLWILRSWKKKGLTPQKGHSLDEATMGRLCTVLEYVKTHYREDITAQAMAGLCNVSDSYFSRLFRGAMQKTFREYLNYVRISEAEKLLLNTDLSITEIALEVGFSTSSYFIEQFRHFKSVPPGQFRKRLARGLTPLSASSSTDTSGTAGR